ncbi:MAG: heavy metal-binding domain-containing protein [Sandaracinus sp.]
MVDGEAQGPFTAAELSTLWKAGELDANALYWFRGMPAWQPVERYAAPNTVTVPREQVILTTLTAVANRQIATEAEIVSAEVVLTKDILGDFAAGLRDLVGGRSATLQRGLREARNLCLEELRGEAARLGADAVIGVTLAYAPLATGAASVMLVATGTAVALGPPPPPR